MHLKLSNLVYYVFFDYHFYPHYYYNYYHYYLVQPPWVAHVAGCLFSSVLQYKSNAEIQKRRETKCSYA